MCKMAEKPLSSGQNAFLRSFFLGFGGVFVLKSVFGFLIRTLEAPFIVPLKTPQPPKNGLVGSFSGVLKMELTELTLQSSHTIEIIF